MMRKPAARPRDVRFTLGAPRGSRVFVAGTFNGWDPRKDALSYEAASGMFALRMPLPPGRHEYKFVVDGEWVVDPTCEQSVPNEYGSANSVLAV
jgi:1,4-alpha-glucan branching enzyme